MRLSGRRTSLIIAIVCLLLLAAALLIAHNSPATGYEMSIYSSTPALAWICLFLAWLGGLALIVSQVVMGDCEKSRMWLVGFAVLLLAHVSLLSIPYVRGYAGWSGDNITHWGHLLDILKTGHFTKLNSYPVTHVLLAEAATVTGLPAETVANLSTGFLSVGCVLSTYLLATAVLPHKSQQILAAAAAAAVMPFGLYHVLVMPNGWSILLFPLLLFAAFKCETWSYLVVALILIILYPFFHPLSSLMAAAALVAIVLLRSGLRYVLGSARIGSRHPVVPILTLAGIDLAILFPWLLSFEEHMRRERFMWDQITSGGPDVIGGMGQSLNKVDVHGLGLLVLLVKMYGVELILIGTAMIGGLVLIRRLRSSAKDAKSFGLLVLLGLMLLFGSLYLLYLVGVPGLGAIGAPRLLAYTMIPTMALLGFALYRLAASFGRHPLVAAGIFCIIGLAAVLSILGLYDSPYRLRPSIQITRTDMAGMAWFIDNKDRGLVQTEIMSPVFRFADGLLGVEESRQRKDIDMWPTEIPDHFGYGNYATLGEQYPEDTYAALTALDTVVYDTVWKQVGRFTRSDFAQLQEDPTVAKIYTNGELKVYLIHGLG